MIDTETKLKIVELRSKDKSIQSIAKELKLAKQTVVDVCKDMNDEIATLRAVQLEALYESEKLSTEARIRNLSSVLSRIREELDSRSLADVPTEKLVDLYLKTSSQLDGAIVEPVFKSSKEQEEERRAREALDSLMTSTEVVRK